MKDFVQSCVGFQNFTIPLNCLETIVLLIIMRWLFTITSMLVIFALLLKIGSSTIVAGLVISFLMVEGIIVYLISFQSNISLLRYINIFTLMDIHFSLFEYQNAAIFTSVLSMKKIMLATMLLIIIVSIIVILTSKNELVYSKTNVKHFRRISSHFTAHSKLVIHEIYHSLIHKKGLIILVLLCVYFSFKQDVYKPHFIDDSYFQLIERFQGKYDEKMELELNELIHTVEIEEASLSFAYNQMRNGQVSADYYYKKWQDSYPIISLSNALKEIQFQLARINHEQKAVVDYEGYKVLFDYDVDPYRLNGTTVDYVVLVVALSTCVAPLFSNDNYKNIKEFYITTSKGSMHRNVSKVITSILYAIIITLIFSVWKYAAVNKYFILDCGNEKIWNIPDLLLMNEALTLNHAYLIQAIVRGGQMILLSQLFLVISKNSKTVFSTIMKSLILTLVPVLLLYLGYSFIESYVPSWYFLRLEAFIFNSDFVFRQVVCILLILFFSTFSMCYMKKK